MSKEEALDEWYQKEHYKVKPLDPSYFAYSGYRCYYCSFETDGNGSKSLYESHVKDKHGPEYPTYPNKADIERLGLEAQGKSWEIWIRLDITTNEEQSHQANTV